MPFFAYISFIAFLERTEVRIQIIHYLWRVLKKRKKKSTVFPLLFLWLAGLQDLKWHVLNYSNFTTAGRKSNVFYLIKQMQRGEGGLTEHEPSLVLNPILLKATWTPVTKITILFFLLLHFTSFLLCNTPPVNWPIYLGRTWLFLHAASNAVCSESCVFATYRSCCRTLKMCFIAYKNGNSDINLI